MTIFLVFLILHVAVNLWMTGRVRRSDNPPFKKKMMIAMMWITPFFGALTAFGETRVQSEPDISFEPPIPGILTETAPNELRVDGLAPFDFDTRMAVVNGFPLVQWDLVSQWASSANDESLRLQALEAAKRAWLLHMRDFFGPPYRLYESEQAYVLSRLPNNVVVAAAGYVVTARNRIQHALDGVAQFQSGQKSILLVIDEEETYCAYLACYAREEGEMEPSDGTYLHAGCGHFAVRRDDLGKLEPIITQEMTRDAVAHLSLPDWLVEGLAVNSRYRFHGAPLLRNPQALRQMHMAYWGDGAIQEFWSGQSFDQASGVRGLSHDLARVIVEHMASDWAAFKAFVLSAKRTDAGQQAAVDKMGIDLGAYVCALLEKPVTARWAPTPSLWEAPGLDVV